MKRMRKRIMVPSGDDGPSPADIKPLSRPEAFLSPAESMDDLSNQFSGNLEEVKELR